MKTGRKGSRQAGKIRQDIANQVQERTGRHKQTGSPIKTRPLPEVSRPDYQEQGQENSTKSDMARSTFEPDFEEPIYLTDLNLFCGDAPGAAVAREHMLGTGLNLARPLVRHRLMVDCSRAICCGHPPNATASTTSTAWMRRFFSSHKR